MRRRARVSRIRRDGPVHRQRSRHRKIENARRLPRILSVRKRNRTAGEARIEDAVITLIVQLQSLPESRRTTAVREIARQPLLLVVLVLAEARVVGDDPSRGVNGQIAVNGDVTRRELRQRRALFHDAAIVRHADPRATGQRHVGAERVCLLGGQHPLAVHGLRRLGTEGKRATVVAKNTVERGRFAFNREDTVQSVRQRESPPLRHGEDRTAAKTEAIECPIPFSRDERHRTRKGLRRHVRDIVDEQRAICLRRILHKDGAGTAMVVTFARAVALKRLDGRLQLERREIDRRRRSRDDRHTSAATLVVLLVRPPRARGDRARTRHLVGLEVDGSSRRRSAQCQPRVPAVAARIGADCAVHHRIARGDDVDGAAADRDRVVARRRLVAETDVDRLLDIVIGRETIAAEPTAVRCLRRREVARIRLIIALVRRVNASVLTNRERADVKTDAIRFVRHQVRKIVADVVPRLARQGVRERTGVNRHRSRHGHHREVALLGIDGLQFDDARIAVVLRPALHRVRRVRIPGAVRGRDVAVEQHVLRRERCVSVRPVRIHRSRTRLGRHPRVVLGARRQIREREIDCLGNGRIRAGRQGNGHGNVFRYRHVHARHEFDDRRCLAGRDRHRTGRSLPCLTFRRTLGCRRKAVVDDERIRIGIRTRDADLSRLAAVFVRIPNLRERQRARIE